MKLFRLYFALVTMLFCNLYIVAQDSTICHLRDTDGRIREHNFDFIKMKLDVQFDTKMSKVIGHVRYDLKPIQYVVDTLFLNAPGIKINTALLDGKPVKFSQDSLGITFQFMQNMDWNKQYKLDISYEATPLKGLYFIGWNVPEQTKFKDRYYTRKQIWTQGQGVDNRYWIPCYDDVNDKLITETTITFDSAYTVVSNGVLKQKVKNVNGTTTWSYAMNKPMVPYLIMLAVDKYAYKDYKSKNGNVSRQYYYADQPQTVEPTYRYSAEMMDWLCEQTGVAYPWQVYSNTPVQDFMYGAMENTTATIYGDFYLNDERSILERPYIATNAHELTHQWFGDYITESSGTHHWLHESFATYYAKQFIHSIYGQDRYESDRRGEQISAINADNADRFPIAHTHGGSSRHYPKGSAVIDMMRYVVGDSVFLRCVTAYLKKHAYANVVSDDFKRTFMETAGVNLDWFFDQWVYRAGYPKYEVKYERLTDKVAFYITQTQRVDELTSYFKMPIQFEVYFKDSTAVTSKVWISHATDTVYLNAPQGKVIDYTLFDPSSCIIKQVEFKKSFEELTAQAQKARHFIDRQDALLALRDIPVTDKRDLLINLFSKNNFRSFQGEIINQLSDDTLNIATTNLFKKALTDSDFLVRRYVIDYLPIIPQSILAEVEKLLQDTSYITIENTLSKLCKQYPENRTKYLKATQGLSGINNNVRILWLEIQNTEQVLKTDNNLYQKALVEYCSNKYEFRTRTKAIEAVERWGYCDEYVIQYLLNAATSSNSRLANPAYRSLKRILLKPENKTMAKVYYEQNTWKDFEKKVIEPLFK